MRPILNRLSLRYKILLGGIAAALAPFLIVSVVIYYFISGQLEGLAREKSLQIAEDLSQLVQNTLAQETKLATAFASDAELSHAVVTRDYGTAETILKRMYERSGSGYVTFFIADAQGIVRADAEGENKTGISIVDRDYFIKAKEGKPAIGDPVVSGHSGNLMLSVAVPIKDGGRLAGVFVSAVNIDSMVEIISSTRLGKTGYAFVTASDTTAIVHPRKDFILKRRMQTDPGMEKLLERILNKETGSESYNFFGTEKIAGFAPVGIVGWYAIFTQDRDEIMEPAGRILFRMLMAALIFIIITVTTIIILSGRISTPVQRMMSILKQLTMHSEDIIMNIGVDRRIIFVNPAAERILGKPADELTGVEPALDNINNTGLDEIWDTLEHGQTWAGRLVHSEGKREPVILAALILPIRDEAGKIQSYLSISRDITNELALETRLRQSQKMEAMGVMAGGIAHDFNNILSGIFGYAELSLMALDDEPEHVRQYLNSLLNSAERARELVHQILTFSRQTELELRPVSPKYIVKEAVKLLRASTPARIDIRASLNSEAAIMAEPTQLHQVIVNLCTNAVYAMRDMNGTLDIRLDELEVGEAFIKLRPGLNPGMHIQLSVADTGRGIEPKDLERIFEPFFTTKPQGEGTGLGLSVVHGIVRKMKGIITVSSEVGKGSVFNVIIPQTTTDKADALKAEAALRGGTERIMLIDDEEVIINVLQPILANLGYRVSAFGQGGEALDAFRKAPGDYDLVITDYSMPRMTGLDIAKEMKNIRPDIPIILSSGFISQAMEDFAGQAGISGLLKKPAGVYKLSEAVRQALGKGTAP
jgi:PAS domain S-box-containing protein